jgi:biofilm PGA synthesis N-glycosyltransferase PgaC
MNLFVKKRKGKIMIGIFELYYPILMSFIWIFGSIYLTVRKKKQVEVANPASEPTVDIFMACHNEEDLLYQSVKSLSNQNYQNYRIVLIDDGSDDKTFEQMELAKHDFDSQIELIKLNVNGGKSHALNTALNTSQAEFVLCVDADSILNKNTLALMVRELATKPDLAAVTGRPMVLNKTKLIAKLQFIEYFLNIDFIKRAQYYFGGLILTVSGVLTLYRSETLKKVGGWNEQALTEDIDVTWKFYDLGFNCGYVPEALCYIRVPETVKGFLRQRIRWARGGLEVWHDHIFKLPSLSFGRRWLLLDMTLSYLWIFLVSLSLLSLAINYQFLDNLNLRLDTFCAYYVVTILFYITANLMNKHSVAKQHWKLLGIVPIYFFFYWLNNIISTVAAFYHLFDRREQVSWRSSDRGRLQ